MENLTVNLKTTSTQPQAGPQKANNDQLFYSWLRTLPRSAESKPLIRPRLKTFFQNSEQLISREDAATTHQTIEKPASEGGLARIAELTQFDSVTLRAEDKVQTLDTLYLPFLRTITHKDVLSSMMLEKAVGDIYVFLYGISGRRALALFNSLAVLLQARLDKTPDESLTAGASTVLTTLLQVLECNQTASLQGGLQAIVDVIQACLDTQKPSLSGTLQDHAATQNMAKVRRYLSYGASLQPVQTPAIAHANQKVDFEMALDLPGALSASGPRHDNDRAKIKHIKILPTAQEIRSLRSEYLPVKDPSKWHIQGIGGLLDQQFRLLREDTVGLLRDSVRIVMEDFLNPQPRSASRRKAMGFGSISIPTLHSRIFPTTSAGR